MRKICALVLAAAILHHSNAKKIKTKGGKRFLLTRPLCKENIKRIVVFMPRRKAGRAIFSPLPAFCRGYILADIRFCHSDIFADIHRHFHYRNGFAAVIFGAAAFILGDFYYRPRLPLIVMPSPSKSTETVLLSVMLRSIMPSAMLSSSFCSITLLKGRAPYSIS